MFCTRYCYGASCIVWYFTSYVRRMFVSKSILKLLGSLVLSFAPFNGVLLRYEVCLPTVNTDTEVTTTRELSLYLLFHLEKPLEYPA